jgi:hypothetical protein
VPLKGMTDMPLVQTTMVEDRTAEQKHALIGVKS